MRQIRENKHCGKKTILQLASGDNVAPHAVPSTSEKNKHVKYKFTKVIITRPTIQIRLASYSKLAKTTVPTPTTNFSS